MSIFALLCLICDYTGSEPHPIFPQPSGPRERKQFLQNYQQRQIRFGWKVLGICVLIDISIVVLVFLLS